MRSTPLILAPVLLATWLWHSAVYSNVEETNAGPSAEARGVERLKNPGFEVGEDGTVPGWGKYELGYEVSHEARTGKSAIVCRSLTTDERRGAYAVVELNQERPMPFLVEGYSRAEAVSGFRNNDYSIYVDVYYKDGTPLWGQTAPFATGTHGWQRARVLVHPAKPVKAVYVHALFRHHSGTVWFDDFSFKELDPGATFDSQFLKAPTIRQRSGWFVRDVAEGTELVPWTGAAKLGLSASVARWDGPGEERLQVSDLKGQVRCVTIYYVERQDAQGLRWWRDMRRSELCGSAGEFTNQVRLGVGATGSQSLYPLACVTGRTSGRALAIPPEQGAVVARLGYHAASRLLYCAYDVVLHPENEFNRRNGLGTATVRVIGYAVDPDWGFRSALAQYYSRYPEVYRRRAAKEGIWIPFTSPSTVRAPEDFGFGYHEGDNSVAADDRMEILSFRYTEPMTWWMPMDPSVPRTYEAAMELLQGHLSGNDKRLKQFAQSVIHSGSHAEDGHFNVEFVNAPWTNGAVWVLNPNPAMVAPPGETTRAEMAFGKDVIKGLYDEARDGVLDGEYLDSLEGWADVLDFRPESLRRSTLAPTFRTDDLRPTVPTFFSVYEFARYMRGELRKRNKLLMANATPWRIHAFSWLLDVMGTETNWMPDGQWRPDSDEVFCLRRALSYQRPYLLLQNTDFDRFGPSHVERYMKRSMAYGVYPSMFSVDASSRNYWTQPQWYERDRARFRRYIPVIARLSRAGWMPITGARSSEPSVYVERFGSSLLTVFNDSEKQRSVNLALDPHVFGRRKTAPGLREVFSGRVYSGRAEAMSPGRPVWRYSVKVGPEDCLVLEVQ